jgi:hypothetical protein
MPQSVMVDDFYGGLSEQYGLSKPLQGCRRVCQIGRHVEDDYEPIIQHTTFGITVAKQHQMHLPLLTSEYVILILCVLWICNEI